MTNRSPQKKVVIRIVQTALCTFLATLPLTYLGLAQAAPKKPAKEQGKADQKPSAETVKNQVQYLDTLESELKRCRAQHLSDIDTLKSKIEFYMTMAQGDALMERRPLTAVELEKAREKAVKSAEEVAMHKKCKSNASTMLSETGRDFIQNFKPTSLQGKAKEAMAQWMTALDATSTNNFDQEMSKFNTLANALKLELTLN